MDKFIISAGKNTPKIDFDPDLNHFEVSGRSFPENAGKFYKPIYNWVRQLEPVPDSTFNIDFKFYYISTSSLICVLDLLKLFSLHEDKGCKIIVNWHYNEDDDDIISTGEDLASLSKLQFEYKVY